MKNKKPVNLSRDFDEHWSVFSTDAIPQKKIEEADSFLKPAINIYRDKKVFLLDAGCGNCVHAEALKNRNFSNGSIFVGLDISLLGMRSVKRRIPDWFLINADIAKLPFIDNGFDIVLSFGVLGYVDDPKRSFKELCRVVKKGGLLGIWLSPRKKSVARNIFNATRMLCRLTGPRGTRVVANFIVPLLMILPTRSKVNLFNATWKQCYEVVMVNINPEKFISFERTEARQWCAENDIKIVAEDENNPITIWGRKN